MPCISAADWVISKGSVVAPVGSNSRGDREQEEKEEKGELRTEERGKRNERGERNTSSFEVGYFVYVSCCCNDTFSITQYLEIYLQTIE
jgi:hypothetical protein